MHRHSTAVSWIVASRLVCRHFGYHGQNIRLRRMKLIRVWGAVNYEALSEIRQEQHLHLSAGELRIRAQWWRERLAAKHIERMQLKMRPIGTCDDALPQGVGCNPLEVAVVGCYRESEEWMSRIYQKTLLSRAGHRHSLSAAWPFSEWAHLRAKCTGQDDERVPNIGMGTYVSLTMGTAHADGLGLVALVERCPGWVCSSVCVLTLIFLTRQVRHPVLLLVYFGRFLCWGSLRGWGATTWT